MPAEAEVELPQRHAQECRLIFGPTEALVVTFRIFMLLTAQKERNRKQH